MRLSPPAAAHRRGPDSSPLGSRWEPRHAEGDAHTRTHSDRRTLALHPYPQILRERVKACYKEAGVNHLQDCAGAVDAYLEAIRGGSGTALLNAGVKEEK